MSVATKLQAVYDAISSMKSAITSKGQVLTDVPLSGWASKINAIETGGGMEINGQTTVSGVADEDISAGDAVVRFARPNFVDSPNDSLFYRGAYQRYSALSPSGKFLVIGGALSTYDTVVYKRNSNEGFDFFFSFPSTVSALYYCFLDDYRIFGNFAGVGASVMVFDDSGQFVHESLSTHGIPEIPVGSGALNSVFSDGTGKYILVFVRVSTSTYLNGLIRQENGSYTLCQSTLLYTLSWTSSTSANPVGSPGSNVFYCACSSTSLTTTGYFVSLYEGSLERTQDSSAHSDVGAALFGVFSKNGLRFAVKKRLISDPVVVLTRTTLGVLPTVKIFSMPLPVSVFFFLPNDDLVIFIESTVTGTYPNLIRVYTVDELGNYDSTRWYELNIPSISRTSAGARQATITNCLNYLFVLTGTTSPLECFNVRLNSEVYSLSKQSGDLRFPYNLADIGYAPQAIAKDATGEMVSIARNTALYPTE